MTQAENTREAALLEEAITVLFCEIDDTYRHLNPNGQLYESLKRLSDPEVITLALFQQLRGVESCRAFYARSRPLLLPPLPRRGRPCSFLFSSPHPQAQAIPRTLEADRRGGAGRRARNLAHRFDPALGNAPQRGFSQSAGFEGAAWVRWGSFSVYGVKLHLLCASNRVPICYELTPANVADLSLTEELCAEAKLGEEVARKLLGDLAYRSAELEDELAELGILLLTERSRRRPGVRQQIEIALASLKRVFGLGETLATTLVGLATRIAAKMTAYTYAFLINRRLGRPQGKIKELWA